MTASWTVQDALYGEIRFSDNLRALANSPAVQRLRHVRLSNIDSLAMPGIAGITRFEHVVGATFLVSQLGMARRLDQDSRRSLEAAILLHDAAITPFGHLVEEALMYVGASFHHEDKWSRLAAGEEAELGGVDLQLYCGRRAGITEWARKFYGTSSASRVHEIIETIKGVGRFGSIVSGELDLDNLDNVSRIAFHMGLRPDVGLPIRLAQAIVDCDEHDGAVFADTAPADVNKWLSLRERVYTHLMTAPEDFAGKLMLIHATIRAMETKELQQDAWALSDWEYLHALVSSADAAVRETVQRWLLGDRWDTSALVWMRGKAPDFPEVRSFSAAVGEALGRECFAYRIKDKRNRALKIRLRSGATHSAGRASQLWLLGVGSPVRREFTASDVQRVTGLAAEYFNATSEGPVTSQLPVRSLFDV